MYTYVDTDIDVTFPNPDKEASCQWTAYSHFPRSSGLKEWRSSLLAGKVPAEGDPAWPAEPLRGKLLLGIREIGLPALLSEQPELVNTVLLNVLQAVEDYQKALGLPAKGDEDSGGGSPSIWSFLGGSLTESTDVADPEPSDMPATAATASEVDVDSDASEAEDLAEAGQLGDREESSPENDSGESTGGTESFAEQVTRQFIDTWRALAAEAAKPRLQSWQPRADADSEPSESFAECTGTEPGSLSEPEGWDHLLVLRELLGRLPELRDLVRRMGRRSGLKSSLRFDQAQRAKQSEAPGIVRSDRTPCETSGITRSDGSLLLLPSELSLLAYANAQPARENSAGARALHRLRRAEAALLSYERSAWIEEPAETLRWREFRPASERGPLICCVDTSRSMAGRREAVAKAAVLEVLLLAEAERRTCYLYFFSGPGDLEELEVPKAPIPAQRPALTSRAFSLVQDPCSSPQTDVTASNHLDYPCL